MKEVTANCLFNSIPDYMINLFKRAIYPWEVLPEIKSYIKEIYNDCLNKGFSEYSDGVLIGKNTSVAPTATIIGPAIIGNECEIRPGAYIRGCVITGTGCVIGNSSEIKNSVLLDFAQLPHFNYAGDSIIGNYAHMGAAAICSNLKGDKSIICVKTDPPISTGMIKFGAILADHSEIGCGCVLNPGTVVGQNSRIYPLTSVRGVIPPNSLMKSPDETVPLI